MVSLARRAACEGGRVTRGSHDSHLLSLSQGLAARGALAVALGPGGELSHLKFAEVKKSIKGQKLKSVKIVI